VNSNDRNLIKNNYQFEGREFM